MTLGFTAFVTFNALNKWSGCEVDGCLQNMFIVRNLAAVLIYCVIVLCLIRTGLYI